MATARGELAQVETEAAGLEDVAGPQVSVRVQGLGFRVSLGYPNPNP